MEVPPDSSADVTQTLEQCSDRDAGLRLMLLVKEELRARASDYLRRELPDHTLQATALVHKAYLKMAIEDQVTSKNRAYFCAVAASLMRRILVQHARDQNRQKRYGRGPEGSFDDPRWLDEDGAPDLVALDEALERFGLTHPRASAVVEMKVFGGMDTREIAEVLNVPENTVLSDWSFAKAWLPRALRQRAANPSEAVARLFKSISECSETQLAEFIRIPSRR